MRGLSAPYAAICPAVHIARLCKYASTPEAGLAAPQRPALVFYDFASVRRIGVGIGSRLVVESLTEWIQTDI